MKKAMVLLAPLGLGIWLAWANDRSIVGIGGSYQLLQGEHRSLQMVSEDIKMEVRGRLVFTSAQFEFSNQGPATEVTMGFPEGGHGDINNQEWKDQSSFWDFQSSVDGRALACRRVWVKTEPETQVFQAHWLKRVAFPSGSRRAVRVNYVAKVGTIAGGQYFAEYLFSGGTWRGKVNKSTLQADIQPGDFKLMFNQDGWRQKGTRAALAVQQWEAEKLVGLYFQPGVKGYLFPPLVRDLSESDLAGRSAKELTLMRNEIFARYGRPFKDPELRRYFSAQPWYREFPRFQEAMAEEEEGAARAIAAYQKKHGLDW